MNVTCPDCSSVFRVDPAKVPGPGVRARCGVCGGVIDVVRSPETLPQSAAETAPAYEVAYATDTASVPTPPAEKPVSSQAASGPASVAGTSGAAPPAVQETGSAPPRVVGGPSAPELMSATAESGAGAAVEGRPARPFNPYLSNTPELRARRLARALVSDLVAYNPQKREEGLRDGTLRQLFRDEIRKSWEEYVEQVGAHVAESTPHFQDALNDVLAGGRRVF